MAHPLPTLVYVHDPMCSWCWAFAPAFDALCAHLGEHILIRRLLGGLAPDSDAPMSTAMQGKLVQTWQTIQEQVPGTRFNFDFWTGCQPRRSTWPACRAVIAARSLEPAAESAMIRAIQRAYYLQARNPSDRQTLVDLANECGLDVSRFADMLDSAHVHAELDREMASARAMGANSFPSLRVAIDGELLPLTVHYTEPTAMLAELLSLARKRGRIIG